MYFARARQVELYHLKSVCFHHQLRQLPEIPGVTSFQQRVSDKMQRLEELIFEQRKHLTALTSVDNFASLSRLIELHGSPANVFQELQRLEQVWLLLISLSLFLGHCI